MSEHLPDTAAQDEQLETNEQQLRNLLDAVEHAREYEREVGDETARDIARRMKATRSDEPALTGFIAAGIIRADDKLYREVYEDTTNKIPDEQVLADALLSYCVNREDKGMVANWCRDEFDRETESGYKPRVYVASLSDYNNGILHGVWIDAYQEYEEVREQVSWMLRSAPGQDAEEYAIHDFDEFAGIDIHEYTSLGTVVKLAKKIAKHGEAFGAWIGYTGMTDDENIRKFDDAYQGHYDSMQSYCEEYVSETDHLGTLNSMLETVPEDLRQYVKFDYDAMARDWNCYYVSIEAHNGGVHIFDATV